jgi:hypothetical protein
MLSKLRKTKPREVRGGVRNYTYGHLWSVPCNVCGWFDLFITFTDDFSRYGYIYSIKE